MLSCIGGMDMPYFALAATMTCWPAGVELMCIILKQKRLSRAGALKALDFATTRQPAACERLVDMGGLKSLFAIFMSRGRVRRAAGSKGGDEAADQQAAEERAVSVIANLMMVPLFCLR